MDCSGLCKRLKTKMGKGEAPYDNHKRCTHCGEFISTQEIRCPCCDRQLRNGPRKKELKLKRITTI